MVKTLFSATSSPPPLLLPPSLLLHLLQRSSTSSAARDKKRKRSERSGKEPRYLSISADRLPIIARSRVPIADLRQVFNVSGCSSISPRCFCTSDAQQRMSLPREIASKTCFSHSASFFPLFLSFLTNVVRSECNNLRCPVFLNYAVSLPQFLGDGKLIMSLHII